MDDRTVATLARIAAALKAERRARGLKLRDLADELGCDLSVISNMENGKGPGQRAFNPLASFLVRWAATLGCEIALVLRNEGGPKTGRPAVYARLTPEIRATIRAEKGKTTAAALAETHGVSRQTIYTIWNETR